MASALVSRLPFVVAGSRPPRSCRILPSRRHPPYSWPFGLLIFLLRRLSPVDGTQPDDNVVTLYICQFVCDMASAFHLKNEYTLEPMLAFFQFYNIFVFNLMSCRFMQLLFFGFGVSEISLRREYSMDPFYPFFNRLVFAASFLFLF